MVKKIKFGAMIHGIGGTTDGWRHPSVPADASVSLPFYKERARLAEKANFSFIFVADGLSINEKSLPHFLNRFEPITLLTAIAGATERIGIVGTLSTSYSQPFNVARQFLSLDHISAGRAGWNVVTSPSAGAAQNFNETELPSHEERYKKASEHLTVVKGLWDSWEDGAFVRNKDTGEFFDKEKMHALNHEGEFFSVKGPLNLERSPQGYPVIFQAGSSERGKKFAAESADAIFTGHETLEEAIAFYHDVKTKAAENGRSHDDILIFPGISPIVADTVEEANKIYEDFISLVPIDNAITYLGRFFDQFDFSVFPLDEPFPDIGDIGKEAFQSTTDKIKRMAKENKLTLRQVAQQVAVPRSTFIGTPEIVADKIQSWFESGGADGFIINSDIPSQFKVFVEKVVPILQARGIYEEEYSGSTLRDHLGLKKPINQHSLKNNKALEV
ncbi:MULTISPECIES: LLM class flavin-dependent oxidoreductase [Bacillaceae]|uniref:LLM class flavin-dependent oxidoreductase n=1 Tax=Bacillaceae TaxID=186817 RepID=UPI001E5EE7BF|nr:MULTISPECIES: LLM class flavin-dependent oxidoreductase [Bacillaceae]MCE4050720.1 LLM class flavin-dependent oxidoreductase [Bacillus sp. Au-Bac7]MCM3031659.1 LLM class flavin-dependent oxidoreductase [Niallia sp. MER 6]UPO89822.1 LLM class flavin-dependent oxidoreductase [Niallia sp. Man26]